MMVPKEKFRLGEGLPARFAGDQGFSRLCSLLEINREERKAIVGVIRRARTLPVFRDLSTKERHRFYITYFYSQPVERRVLWKKTLAAIDEPRRHPPSLELRALLAYDPECLDREVNDQDIASVLDVPDLLESTTSVPDWQRPALAVWPGLRDEVLGWAACSPERRDAVVAALFAVATILDDVRLFGWAAEQARELAAEFAFALASRTTEENVADEGQVLPALGSDFLRKWTASWARVVSLAAVLETAPPQPLRSEDEGRLMAAIGELQAALQTIEANRPEKLVERVPDTIAAMADEYDAPWLQAAVDQIHAQWKLMRLAADDITVDRLRAEIDRVDRELPDVLRAWSHSRNEIERLEAELRETPDRPPGDLTSLLSVEGRKRSLLQAVLECQARTDDYMQRVLQKVAPDGCEFEPSRDYASEWSETSAVSAGGAAGPEAVPKPDDASGESLAREQQGAASDHSASMDPTERADTTTDTDATDGEPGEPAIPAGSDMAPSHVGALDDAGVPEPLESGDSGQVPVEPTAPPGTTMPPLGAGRRGDDEGEAPSASKAVAALWRFLVDRPGIAYHLSRRLSDRYGSEPALPPPDLLAAAMLADHVKSADDRIAEALKKHLGRVDLADLSREDREIEIQHSLQLLLFCATVRPALIVPATGAAALLRRVNLPDPLAPVCDLATAVAERAERLQRIRLDVSLFGAAFSQSGWSERMEGLRARTQDWLGRARNQRILYGPAHRVWKHWLGESSRLRTLAGLITEADPGNRPAAKVEEICEELRAPKSFRELVEDTDSAIRTLKRGSIEGRALPALQQHVQPLLGLADEWLRLVAVKPDPKMNFVERNLDALRRTVVDSGGHAAEAIEKAATTAVAGPFGSTLKRATMTVSALGRLFKDTHKSDIRYEDPDHILTRDLLYVTAADVDVRGRLAAVRDGADMLSVLSHSVNHVDTMRAAHETRLSRGDLLGARLAYREMEAAGDPEDDLEQCRALLDEAERKRRIELRRNRTELQEVLEQLFCFGQIAEEDAVGLRADLVEVGVRLDDASAGDVGVLETRIGGIRRSISEYRNRGVTEAREKFGNLSARCDADARSRIEQAIDQGDLLTANELMSRIETGEGLDSGWQDQDDPLRDFMSAVEGIERSRGAPNGLRPDVVVRAVKNREAVAGLGFDAMSESEAEHASQLIGAWYRLSREKRFDKETVENLLTLLGMPVRRSRMEKDGRNWARINLETDVLQDRSRCPLPQFGSAARGRYSLLLDWGTSARESIPQIMGRGHDLATIVLHFGCLGTDREWLRSWAVAQHRLALVVDETLVLFLSSRGSGRLPALFHCALPFTDVDPYVTTSGLVPPELFFGRAYERRRVMDKDGACFIYGGRQLGKTALLKSVEREFHRPERWQLAKCIDLKVREIGHARRAAEIWPLLWRELRQLDVVTRSQFPNEPNPENRKTIDKLIAVVERWIGDHPESRLLLLLDEADAFLEDDARGDFRESTRLKGLMDRTDRRVKVVFAGLHNVLRTTERANHPLAHLGDPINVGPLLSNGEWIQAQNLVREPLRSVGYRFESKDLSTLILAQTNYYPSLIQLYGAGLVRRLRDSGKPVPYDVREEDIGSVYQSKDLRNAIRERFQLTLQLDQRYEVIAYALTLELLDDAQRLRDGLARQRIKEDARGWWPEGFGEDDREFNVLLQEMEGLGVLRPTANGQRYTLRNPNILLLLGNKDEIEQVLEKSREAPKRFEPASYHGRPADRQGSHQESDARRPLTYGQESTLRATSGVAVIAGCTDAVGNVTDGLSLGIDSSSFQTLDDCPDAGSFRQSLMKAQPRSANVTNVVLVPQREDWNVSWLEQAERALRKKKTGRWIRVVFVADPEQLWRVMTDLEDRQLDPEWIGIGPWDDVFVRHWLADNNLPHAPSNVQELMDVSGGWPMVLDTFVEAQRLAWDGRIEKLRAKLAKSDEWLSRLGVTPAVRTELWMLLQHRPFGPEDIASIAGLEEGVDSLSLERRVQWSERLGLLSRVGDQWKFNPLVETLLRGEFG